MPLVTEQPVDRIAQLDQRRSATWIIPAPECGPIRRNAWTRRAWKFCLTNANFNRNLGAHTLRRSQKARLTAQGEHPTVIADPG